MAIVDLNFLNSLSYKSAENLLLQEGYIVEKEIEEKDPNCDKIFLYPYVFYDDGKREIDCIFYIEYCNLVVDDEFIDGRMTWETVKTEWRKKRMFMTETSLIKNIRPVI